ncbi:Yip1 family protein [Sporolituus thermophilus]|uniref:Yip1 domain-containing protein n=1 Tax=Sporolituus thermophilus DSM 23256 TaxID=1123285 RepID=A0A1G7IUN4_9FIRM|nr:Yip1 family protein [Sporolituus thermophilus]SDF16286.1 Yip1 domain-containing protein [Sporolituus thermophilus DSM 23256]
MGQLLETLYDVLFHPTAAMRRVASEKRVGQAVLVFLVSVLLPVWGLYFGLKAAGMPQTISVVVLFQLLGSLLLWVIGAGLLHLIAEFFGGRGSALGLFAALGFAQFPRIFIVPLWVLAALLPDGARPLAMAASALFILFWILALHVVAIKGAHALGGAKAALVLAIPFLAAMAIVAMIVIFVSAVAMRWPLFY